MTELAAQPKYARGETVMYVDQHGRVQTGTVTYIQANWPGHSTAGAKPYCVYTLTHPTYRNNRMYAGDDDIRYALKTESPS